MNSLTEAYELLSKIGSPDARLKEQLAEEGFFGSVGSLFSKHKKVDSHVTFSPEQRLFVGHIGGVPFKPQSERGLFKHLIAHGHTADQSQEMISKFKAGSSTGISNLKAEHSLNMALHHAHQASIHHANADYEARDHHLAMTSKHLDVGFALAANEFKHNPKALAMGNKHPIHGQLNAIHDIISRMPDESQHHANNSRRATSQPTPGLGVARNKAEMPSDKARKFANIVKTTHTKTTTRTPTALDAPITPGSHSSNVRGRGRAGSLPNTLPKPRKPRVNLAKALANAQQSKVIRRRKTPNV